MSIRADADVFTELQVQYSNYKDTLQAIAGKIGDVEQEAEEHKYVRSAFPSIVRIGKRAVTARRR